MGRKDNNIHRRIRQQSEQTQTGKVWVPEQFPELYALIQAARVAGARPMRPPRFSFEFHGKRYYGRSVGLDQLRVETWGGKALAQTWPGAD